MSGELVEQQITTKNISATSPYTITFAGSNSWGDYISLSSVSIITTPPPLPAPSLSFSSATATTLQFTWAEVSAAISYTLSYSSNPALLGTDQAFSKTVSTTSTELTGLLDNTVYYVVIRADAFNALFNSDWSTAVTSGTLSPIPSVPTGFVATSTPSGIVLTWTDVTTETGYRLYRSITNNQPSAPFLIELPQNTVTFTDSTVYSGTRYYYWLQSFHSDGQSDYATTNATSYRIPLLEVKPVSCSHPAVIDNDISSFVQSTTTTSSGSIEITFTFDNPELIGRFGFLVQTNATSTISLNKRITTPGNNVITISYPSLNNLNTLNESSAIQFSSPYVTPVKSITLRFTYSTTNPPCYFSVFEVKFFGYPKLSPPTDLINTQKSDTSLTYTFQDFSPNLVSMGHFNRTPLFFAITSASYTLVNANNNPYDVSLILSSDASLMGVFSTLAAAQSNIDSGLQTFVPSISWSQAKIGAEYFILLRDATRYSIYEYIVDLDTPTALTLIEQRMDTNVPTYSSSFELPGTNSILLDNLLPDNHYFIQFTSPS